MAAMDGKIKIFGSQIPKPVAYGGGILVIVGGIYYYRKQKASAAAAQSVANAGATSIDPATGYPYGSAEDAAALAAQGNYQMPSGSLGGGSSSFGNNTPGVFLSNAEWTQYVENYIVNNEGGSAPIIAAALGAYINGTPLATDQVSIVQTAIAIGGYPPVNGPNGDPPNYTTSGSTTPPGNPPPGNPPPPTNPPPPINPGGPPKQLTPSQVTGLHTTSVGRNSIGLAWDKAENATSYQVRVTYQTSPIAATMTTATSFKVNGLSPNRTYGLHVVAINGNNWAPEASIVQKTTN